MKKLNTKELVYMSTLISLHILFTELISIRLPMVEIGFGFIPLAVIGILFGGLYTGMAMAISDGVGSMLFPPVGGWFYGFTISDIITGLLYGNFLYKIGSDGKKQQLIKIAMLVLIVNLGINLTMNTYWLTILLSKGMLVLLPARVIKTIMIIPIQFIIIRIVINKVKTLKVN